MNWFVILAAVAAVAVISTIYRCGKAADEMNDEQWSDRSAWDTAEWALWECERIAKGEA